MIRHRILLAVLALAICTGTAQATNKLALTPTVVTALACNTNTGGSGSETIKVTAASAAAGSSQVWVTIPTPPAGLTITPSPSTPQALASSTASVTYTVTPTNGCAGSPTETGGSAAYSPVVTFGYVVGSSGSGTPTTDATQSLSIAETTPATTSPLSANPGSVTLSCVLNAGVYSSASTNFTLVTAATVGSSATFSALPSWLGLTSGVGPYSVPATTGLQITASASAAQCASIGGLGSSKTTTLTVTTAAPALPSVALSLPVTITVAGPAQLTVSGTPAYGSASGTPAAMTYTRYGTTQSTSVSLHAANPVYFMVDMTTMPAWLTVSATSGQIPTAGGSASLTFYSTTVADSMTPGVYETGVGMPAISLKVAGYAPTLVYVQLTVQNTTPTLSVQGGSVQNLSWSMGQTFPMATITAVSSGTPIPFTVTTAAGSPDAGASVNPAAGLAYSFGTPIAVTFSAADFAAAAPGETLTSTVVLHWTNGSTPATTAVVFNIAINVNSTTAYLTGITPSSLPSGAAGETFQVVLYGSGFVASSLPTQATFVGVVPAGGALTADSNIVAAVQSSSMITLTITVPSGDSNLPFSTPGSTVTLGVCNPNGSSSTPPCVASSTIKLMIDAGPIISPNGVTSASTFVPGSLAPYDIVSIFGSNFCTSGGTGCASGQVLYPQIVNSVYQNFVTPDVAGSAGERELQVFFCKSASTASTDVIAANSGCYAAPLLFATNVQINAIVPGEALAATSATWDVYVRFGAAPTATTTLGSAGVSSAYPYTAAATDPGVFIVDSSNDGAIVLNSGPFVGNVTNSASNAARLRQTGNSDIVEIYMTGLGTPSTSVTGCTSVSAYATASGLATATPANPLLDGAIIASSNFASGLTAPCFAYLTAGTSPITVTIGGQAPAVVYYVGWAPNAVAGLYQVDVQLPALALSGPTQVSNGASTPVYVTQTGGPLQVPVAISGSSQPIYMYVQPAMTLEDSSSSQTPATIAVTQTELGTLPYLFDTVTATGGNGTPAYAVAADSMSTSPSLPTSGNFAVDSSTGAVTVVNAIPDGTYTITIKATDDGGSPALPAEYITLTIQVTG